MDNITDHLIILFLLSFVLLWCSNYVDVTEIWTTMLAKVSTSFRGATLTLLCLIIGFSFSMAINRYNLRKPMKRPKQIQLAHNIFALIICPQRLTSPRKHY